jgi:hypothetical protein
LLRGCRRAGESCLEPKRAPDVDESYLFPALVKALVVRKLENAHESNGVASMVDMIANWAVASSVLASV